MYFNSCVIFNRISMFGMLSTSLVPARIYHSQLIDINTMSTIKLLIRFEIMYYGHVLWDVTMIEGKMPMHRIDINQ